MNTQFTGHTEVAKLNPTVDGFSKRLLAALVSFAHPVSPHHVGMFAGSLLPYASWAPPKIPH